MTTTAPTAPESVNAVPTIAQVQDWHGKKVLVRVDYNVPLEGQVIQDDTRIQETLPTLRYLLERGAALIVMAHMGRPKGQVKEELRLTPVVKRLQELLPEAASVMGAQEVYSDEVARQAAALQPKAVLVLENVRFEPGEEKNDPALAQKLASLGDVYVNDAFGAAHRAHASTEGVAHYLSQRYAGLLMAKEIQALQGIVEHPQKPFTAIIGGAKVSTKIGVIRQLFDKVDTLIIGGGMVYTFLKAQGYGIGNSLLEADYVETARQILDEAKTKGVELYLPSDLVVADDFNAQANLKVVSAHAIPDGWQGMDSGPDSQQAMAELLKRSKTVLWNGPVGVFEMERFAAGTKALAMVLAEQTQKGECKSVLGGGDTVSAIHQFGMDPASFSHVSTGGGASLEYLEGKTLPGIAVLKQ